MCVRVRVRVRVCVRACVRVCVLNMLPKNYYITSRDEFHRGKFKGTIDSSNKSNNAPLQPVSHDAGHVTGL